jgi:dihydropteroate synthase
MSSTFLCGRFELKLERPLVMGIVNVTPDSFSDGNLYFDTQAAIAHARDLVEQGADILDLGGESTRPGADQVSVQDELSRVLPVIEAIRDLNVPISLDTFKPDVMREALASGVDMINDIYGLRLPGAIEAVADSGCALCVMHMQGEPKTMQQSPEYVDVIAEVSQFLRERAIVLTQAGIDSKRIVLDPGFGFGKTVSQNYEILRQLHTMNLDGYPSLLGMSRKTMIGSVTGRAAPDRLAGSLSAVLAGVARGAKIVRVHDVAQTVDALKVWHAVQYGVEE